MFSAETFTSIVLATLVGQLCLSGISNILNALAMNPKIPKEFAEVYDANDYAKSQKYTRAKMLYSVVSELYECAVLVFGWWFGGGFAKLDQLASGISSHYIYQGLTFLFIYFLIDLALNLPFSIFHTFFLEEWFGFNKTTVGTFVTDRLKSIVLTVVLGGPIMALVLWLLHSMGDDAWWMCWAALAGFTVLMQFIAPVLIMPWFLTFTPLPASDLLDAIVNLTKQLKFEMQGVYEIDGSKRSSHSNAFFTGFGKYKRIALFDTLIKSQEKDEILAVLAHEIGHNKRHHIVYSTILSLSQTLLLFYLSSHIMSSPPLFSAFLIPQPSTHLGLLLSMLVLSPLNVFLSILSHSVSRRFEFEADAYSVTNFGTGKELVEGLKKLSKENATNLTPHWLYVMLNYSHPPVSHRIREIRRLAELKKKRQ